MKYQYIVDSLMYIIIFVISCALSYPLLFILMASIPGNGATPLVYTFIYMGMLYPAVVVFSYSVVVYRIIKCKTPGYYPFLPIIYFLILLSTPFIAIIIWTAITYYL
jgi:hypothetical protein